MIDRPDKIFEPLWESKHHRRRMILLPWLIWAIVIGLVIALVLYASRAHAQAHFDCEQLAYGIGNVAVLRDLGADMNKVIAATLKENRRQVAPAHMAAIEREIRRVWREGLDPEKAKAEVFNRCRAQGGDMGVES